jgi:hypothetical protein
MEELSDEQYGHLSKALNEYCFFGIEPKLSGIEKIIFTMAKPSIDSSKNYKISGKKGASKGAQNGVDTAPYPSPPNTPPTEGGYDSKGKGEGKGKGEPENFFSPPQTHEDEKKPPDPPPEGPPATKEDATSLFNRARELWNSLNIAPGCRDIIIPPAEVPDVLRTLQSYSWPEIANAIENYDWHLNRAGNEYRPPPPYGSLYGFLKKGVPRYQNDEDVKKQFREGKNVVKK